MDGDDIMHSKCPEKQVEFLSQTHLSVLLQARLNTFRLSTNNERKGYRLYVKWTNSLVVFMSLIQQIGLLTAHLHIHLQPSGKN